VGYLGHVDDLSELVVGLMDRVLGLMEYAAADLMKHVDLEELDD